MKIAFLLCLLLCLVSAGCANRSKGNSSYRNYEGDSSPAIRLFDEKPGYPLNTR